MREAVQLRADDRQREMFVASCVANVLNDRDSSDLYVARGQAEPEDAVLVSRSDPRIRISVQVVSAPGQPHIRSDNKNLRKFERLLTKRLRECGIDSGHFSVSWTDQAVRHGLRDEVFASLAAVIRARMSGQYGYFTLRSEDEYEQNPWIVDAVNWINGLRLAGHSQLTVASPTACYLPRDGRWINDAVTRKVDKYGRPGCRGVTLIVDGGYYVDREQVTEYAASFDAPDCPFEHVWVVALGIVQQLK